MAARRLGVADVAPRLVLTAVLLLIAVPTWAQPAAAEWQANYLHRSRGQDYFTAQVTVTTDPDGSALYATRLRDTEYWLRTDPGGRPLEYSMGGSPWVFAPGDVTWTRQPAGQPATALQFSPSADALPDFNQRPDPYLTENLLVRAYDFAAGGKQAFAVYDVDGQGTGIREYQVTLDLADEDGVRLPNGKFRARHLVQMQQTGSGTWFKKARGSQTDLWVDDELRLLRIYRHREPYEVIIQDYDRPDALLSATETAQGYEPPPRLEPDPLPAFDIAAVPGDVVFAGSYQHRSGGADWFVAQVWVKRQPDGTTSYVCQADRATYVAVSDPQNVPIEYRNISREVAGRTSVTTFAPTHVTVTTGDETKEFEVSAGSLPDFNSRPDPYCIQNVLLRHYDLAAGGRQPLTVFDYSATGETFSEYQIALEDLGTEQITVPAGQFTAHHLLLTQLTPSNTWYKKGQGSETDFWVGDDYTVYRILRHREPYEVVLTKLGP